MREIEGEHALERLAGLAERLGGRLRKAVAVRLPGNELHDLLRFRCCLLRSFLGGLLSRSLLYLGHISLLYFSPAHARESGHPVLWLRVAAFAGTSGKRITSSSSVRSAG